MKTTRKIRHATHGPWGDRGRHRSFEELERGLHELSPPTDRGNLALIVSRCGSSHRQTPKRATLTPGEGMPGDAWLKDCPEKLDAQITLMRVDVARLVANGQPIELAGDNLFVDLDLSFENLPTGTRLQVGQALLEVTPEPHNGCLKFRQRFGGDALRLTTDERYRDLRLRGIYAKVIEAGEVVVGDGIEVLRRA